MLWQKNNIVETSYNLALEKSEFERKEKARKLLDFYHDQQLVYVYERLQKHFSDPDKFSLASLNIVRKIIDGLHLFILMIQKELFLKTKQSLTKSRPKPN